MPDDEELDDIRTPPEGGPAEVTPDRRRALAAMAAGGLGAVVAAAALAGPLGLALDPILRRRERGEADDGEEDRGGGAGGGAGWLPVGRVDHFEEGASPRLVVVRTDLRDGWISRLGVPVGPVVVERRPGVDEFRVQSGICPHLGCSVAWSDDRGVFVCPCHRSAFARDGALVPPATDQVNPSPRSLDPLAWRVRDGVLEVRWVRFRTGTSERVPVG